MKTVIIVQARFSSTRLPGKVLREVLKKPLLTYLIERLKHSRLAQEVIIATTENTADDAIVSLCEDLKTPVFRGSETNVLERYLLAARHHNADCVVRVCSDSPLIDPDVLDGVIAFYQAHQQHYDYVSNALGSYRKLPLGLGAEVFPFAVLQEAYEKATEPEDMEHVTPYIYRHPERFRIGHMTYPQDLSHHRWTVDTPEDFALIEKILTSLYPEKPAFSMADVLDLLEKNPAWAELNAHIEQKTVKT